jgi:hypothetical protein
MMLRDHTQIEKGNSVGVRHLAFVLSHSSYFTLLPSITRGVD